MVEEIERESTGVVVAGVVDVGVSVEDVVPVSSDLVVLSDNVFEFVRFVLAGVGDVASVEFVLFIRLPSFESGVLIELLDDVFELPYN